jgi:proline iminopeptidase
MFKKHFILALSVFLFLSCGKESKQTKEKEQSNVPAGGHILVDGTKLEYIVEGEGMPSLVIGSSVYYPKTFSKEIRKHLKMYFIDLRWFAQEYSPVNLDDFSIETIISDIEIARTSLGLHKPILLGHSIHGTIAMEYAKRYPEKISHVIAIGSPNIMGNQEYEEAVEALWATASPERKMHQDYLTRKLNRESRDSIAEQPLVKQYIADAGRYWYDYDYDASWLWDGMTVHHELTGHLFGNIFGDYNMFKQDEKLEVPAYVAVGVYDYIIPYTLWLPEEGKPNLTIELFEMSGHTPQLEEPALFDRRLLEWIKRNM